MINMFKKIKLTNKDDENDDKMSLDVSFLDENDDFSNLEQSSTDIHDDENVFNIKPN